MLFCIHLKKNQLKEGQVIKKQEYIPHLLASSISNKGF